MKIREIIKIIKQDGWVQIAQKGSHRQFKHPDKKSPEPKAKADYVAIF